MMSKNSRRINYTLRVAKAVERKMFCNLFQKLSVFHPLEDYRYIGFGALYFADFHLVHRQLGVKKMVSIEKSQASSVRARYNYNKPFSCIDIQFDQSKIILPQLEWEEPAIIWLDYTDFLNADILEDISTIIRNAVSGSFLLISVNAKADSFNSTDTHKNKLDIISDYVGRDKVPRNIELNQISNKGLPIVYNKIITREIETTLLERNSGVAGKIEFEQLIHLKYKDEVPMYTFGGLIIDKKEHGQLFERVRFTDLSFVSRNEEYFDIQVPNLTFKEIKFLESIMPNGINEQGEIIDADIVKYIDPQIPPADIKKFMKIYQYFPTFAETNLG